MLICRDDFGRPGAGGFDADYYDNKNVGGIVEILSRISLAPDGISSPMINHWSGFKNKTP